MRGGAGFLPPLESYQIKVLAPGDATAGPATLDIGGTIGPLGCLRCSDAPCVRFAPDELAAKGPIDTTFNPVQDVCPTDAIRVAPDGVPSVSVSSCIGCGLCVARCPVGAISLDSTNVAAVSSPLPPRATAVSDAATFVDGRAALARLLIDAGRVVRIDLRRVESQWSSLLDALGKPSDSRRVFGLVARNTFLVLGTASRLAYAGDTNMRIELVAWDDATVAVGELDPGRDLLDALRRLLADLAVIRARYGVKGWRVLPFICCATLPNKRVGYYELVGDIKRRLGIKVYTVPAGALEVLLDRGVATNLATIESAMYVDAEQTDLHEMLERTLRVVIPAEVGLRPAK